MSPAPDHSAYADVQLLDLISRGDEAAFTTLYHRYRDKLYSFALDLSRSPQLAEDIVQDVFTGLWAGRAALAGRELAGSYLYQMTRNRRIDLLRRFSRETLILAELASGPQAGPAAPDALVEYRETQAVLRAAVDQLPARQQEVYRLRREQGLSPTEIATQLGLSVSTVENHLTRALQHLRDHLHRHFTETFLYSLILAGAVVV